LPFHGKDTGSIPVRDFMPIFDLKSLICCVDFYFIDFTKFIKKNFLIFFFFCLV